MGVALVWLVNSIFSLITFVVIVWAVMSWLVAFDVINTRNRFVYQVLDMLDRIVTPIMKPIQRVVPTLGSVDISPVILLLLLGFLRIVFNNVAAPALISLMG
jgi:YggT family protein